MHAQLGLGHFWEQGDLVTHAVAIVLFFLSVTSWSVIVTRFLRQLRVNRVMEGALEAFWDADHLERALDRLRETDSTGIFAGMAQAGANAAEAHRRHAAHGIGAGVSASEFVTRALRNHIVHAQARIESGLTFLASVGSTAPFIGLFGTVWGIYHALVNLSGATTVVLDKVAGPVGEALIMTAAGLFVAIPAVLAYNALTRANRLILAQLDGFAHDLHAFFVTGIKLGGSEATPTATVRLATAGN